MNDVISIVNSVFAVMGQIISLVNNNWILQGGLALMVFGWSFKIVKRYLLH